MHTPTVYFHRTLLTDLTDLSHRSTLVRKARPTKESSSVSQNYDMTILHADELDNTRLATARRRKKKIPAWANRKRLQLSLWIPSMFFSEEQLEVAVINQVYFQKIEPEDIFGSICLDHARDLINAMMMEL